MRGPRVVLASASPRRREILTTLGIDHEVVPADIDEAPYADEPPDAHVRRLAVAKVECVAEQHRDALVVAGDTVVVVDGRILGKPASPDAAVAMLLALAGRTHQVVSGLALASAGPQLPIRSRVDRTRVTFRPFDERVARDYVATGEPMDKAGAYGIQGRGSALVTAVEGDYTTVVGLPVSGLITLLADAGWAYRFERPILRATSTREDAR